jgi:GntR family transcriptional repressor for pyruvate dehydrogenase complex
MSISLPSREGHMTMRRSSSASSLRPVERSRLYEQLVEMLCEHIDDADLQPGDRLPPERELAAQVGVSRASISRRPWPRRFWASSTSGTARAQSCSGPAPSSRSWRLPRGNADCLRSSRREALEVKLAELAARRRSEEDLARIDHALAYMEARCGTEAWARSATSASHAAVTAAARSGLLADLLAEISNTIHGSRVEWLSQSGHPQTPSTVTGRSRTPSRRHQQALTRAGRCRADRRRAGTARSSDCSSSCRSRPETISRPTTASAVRRFTPGIEGSAVPPARSDR